MINTFIQQKQMLNIGFIMIIIIINILILLYNLNLNKLILGYINY